MLAYIALGLILFVIWLSTKRKKKNKKEIKNNPFIHTKMFSQIGCLDCLHKFTRKHKRFEYIGMKIEGKCRGCESINLEITGIFCKKPINLKHQAIDEQWYTSSQK